MTKIATGKLTEKHAAREVDYGKRLATLATGRVVSTVFAAGCAVKKARKDG